MSCSRGLLLRGYHRQGPRLLQRGILTQVRRLLRRRPHRGDNRRQRSSMFRYSGCRSPQICFLCSDCHLRLPHPRCRGVRPRTSRLPSHPTEYVRGTLRTFRTRAVCLMCHRFHQDSSFVPPGKAEQPRRRGFYCRQY